jgi:hypothetical protein
VIRRPTSQDEEAGSLLQHGLDEVAVSATQVFSVV